MMQIAEINFRNSSNFSVFLIGSPVEPSGPFEYIPGLHGNKLLGPKASTQVTLGGNPMGCARIPDRARDINGHLLCEAEVRHPETGKAITKICFPFPSGREELDVGDFVDRAVMKEENRPRPHP